MGHWTYFPTATEAEIVVVCEQLMKELGLSCEQYIALLWNS
jgi:hypothetical protein